MEAPNWEVRLMTSAFKGHKLKEIIPIVKEVGAQGLEICVFRSDGSRRDHVATHLGSLRERNLLGFSQELNFTI